MLISFTPTALLVYSLVAMSAGAYLALQIRKRWFA